MNNLYKGNFAALHIITQDSKMEVVIFVLFFFGFLLIHASHKEHYPMLAWVKMSCLFKDWLHYGLPGCIPVKRDLPSGWSS